MENERPTAKEMKLEEEFVYAARIVDALKNIDLNKDCDRDEAIRAIGSVFIEYKSKIIQTLHI